MTPSEAIQKLDDMRRELARDVTHLSYEVDEIKEEWAALGQMGGRRDDHAAALLERLRPHFENIGHFVARCREQVDNFKANPFGR